MKKKLLVIGINKDVHTTKKIIQELEKRGLEYEFIKWGNLSFLDDKIFFENKLIELKGFDSIFCDVPSYELFLKDKAGESSLYFRLYNELHELCKKAKLFKIRLLNRDFILENPFYNKFSQSQIFNKNKIEAIPTLHLSDNRISKVKRSIEVAGINYPLIVKKSQGGMGQAVWRAQDEKELEKIIASKRNENLIYQPFVKNDCDFRVLVIKNKAIGIMKRTAKQGEWKNNFALGGSVLPFEDEKMKKFSEKVSRKLKLDYVGLDIFKVDGKYKIIEANVFACFEGFEQVFPKINVPKCILNCLKI